MDIKLENSVKQTQIKSCYQCEGKGYTEIRDCGGEVQRTETCSYCEGRGSLGAIKTETRNSQHQMNALR